MRVRCCSNRIHHGVEVLVFRSMACVGSTSRRLGRDHRFKKNREHSRTMYSVTATGRDTTGPEASHLWHGLLLEASGRIAQGARRS
jgi:hypothetical protein